MKLTEAADVLRVIAQHLGVAPQDDAIAAYARRLEGCFGPDVATAVEGWMAAHGPGDAFPAITELLALTQAAEDARWARRAQAEASIAHDAAELVRRRCLPATHPEHLTLDGMVDAMARLNSRYPAARWGMAAAELKTSIERDRAAQAENAPIVAHIGRNRWTDEEAA